MDEENIVSLQEITNYFDFWRQAKQESVSEVHCKKLFVTLKASSDDYKTIPLTAFSDAVSSCFTDQGVNYPLDDIQTQKIIEKLANTSFNGKLKEEIFVAVIRYWTRKPALPLKALIIVDVQNDFIRGALRLDQCPAKEDGEEIIPTINQLIERDAFDILAYTYDWHPADHCSFLSNVKISSVHPSANIAELKVFDKVVLTKPTILEQTMWPDHCLQNGWGAELHPDLRKPDLSKDIVIYKGQSTDVDSYSAFWDNGNLHQTDLFLQLLNNGIVDVYLCGLAFDVCVAYSAADAAMFGFKTFVFEDACRSVDLNSKNETKKKFGSLGIKLVQSSQAFNT